jgi:hypoxanthine phosphoribosyltransferase
MTQAELERGVGEVLIDEETLQARVVELGGEISADYAARDLLLVGVLKGAVFFMPTSCASSRCRVRSTSWRFRGTGRQRTLRASSDSEGPDINVAERHVLVVRNGDSGLTLVPHAQPHFRKPASLEVVHYSRSRGVARSMFRCAMSVRDRTGS